MISGRGPIHVVDEAMSTDAEMSTTFWCGEKCIELFDGTFTPDVDFVRESQAPWGTCEACKKAFESRIVRL